MRNRKIDENFILRLEMMVLIMISLIAVTIAWFILGNNTKVQGIRLQAGGTEYIKVALEADGEDVQDLEENLRYVDIGMPAFANTKAGQMAPGTYGEMKLYITALNDMAKGCSIYINSIPEYVDGIVDDTAPDVVVPPGSVTKSELEKLLKGHVQFYSECTLDQNGDNVYEGLITEENPLVLPLDMGEEKMVTIYWVWPYEYTDLTEAAIDEFSDDKEHLFDKDKYEIAVDEAGTYTEKDYVSFYDYGDTKIGMHVKDLHFYVRVNGLQYEEP